MSLPGPGQRFCKDCRHHLESRRPETKWLTGHLWWVQEHCIPEQVTHLCMAPHLDAVTGKPEQVQRYCMNERYTHGMPPMMCGPGGALWEPKE